MNKINCYPKILIISHNPFSKTQNNGKTLAAFFNGWPIENLAQLYLTLDNVNMDICNNYYRISDIGVLKGFLKHCTVGEVVNDNNFLMIKDDKKYYHKNKIYILVRNIFQNKSSFANLIRSFIWNRVKPWESKNLDKWLQDFKPDLIFFQSSNVPAIFNMVLYIKSKYHIPLIVETTDDYVTPHFSLNPFYLIDVNIMKKKYQNLVSKSECVFAIGDMMAEEYQRRFGGNFKVAMNSIDVNNNSINYSFQSNVNLILTFAGNLGLNRWKTLVKLAKAVDIINSENKTGIKINVFSSSEMNSHIKKKFSKCKCLFFGGYVEGNELEKIRINSDFLIHVESFDSKNKWTTRLSISTKIPEYLLIGRCIIAIGPSDIASIKYIEDNKIGHVIKSKNVKDIKKSLLFLFNDSKLIELYLKNSKQIAHENHCLNKVKEKIQKEIFRNCRKYANEN